MVPENLLCILRRQHGFLDLSVNSRGTPEWIQKFQVGTWNSSVDPGILECILGFFCGFRYFIVDPGFQVWIFGF